MPDDRPWALVQHEPCEECGFDPRTVPESDLERAVREAATRWTAWLQVHRVQDAGIRRRPAPEVWSALEYACHVRDVLQVFSGRIRRALSVEEPEFGWWDHEAAVEAERYNDQDPEIVDAELRSNADALADLLAEVPDGSWERAGSRRGVERFTVAGLARFALHETQHHLADARRSLAAHP